MTQVQVGNSANFAQAQAWWRSTFVRGLAAAELVDFMDGAAARTPRGCGLQVEQVGGAMRSPLTSFWSHTDSDVLISFLCVLQTRSASKPRLTGDQARFGVTASQRKYAAEVELWMADSVAALGAHNAGAYQGYQHERDAPEALYGELGVARLQVRLGLKLTPRGV